MITVTAVGPGALDSVGLITWYMNLHTLTVPYPQFDGMFVYDSWLYYIPSADSNHTGIQRTEELMVANVRIPTRERALIDYIEFIDKFDDEYLYEGLGEYNYLNSGNLANLFTVAESRKLTTKLKGWLMKCGIRY